MSIDWKARLTNKAWLVSTVSLVIVLLQQIGLGQLADYIPKNYADIINSVLVLAGAFGIAVDTSTPGISDNVQQTLEGNAELQSSSDKSTSSTISNAIQVVNDNLASSKISVDNPDNIQAIGQEVNHVSANMPQ
ncbi:phage holin [Clostridium sp. YIM B02500]|uniref:phage holin n=1 Tax=Clostridium sp. YIM B02500 TaxID=2910681 RepID=UPI001EED4E62|nr:phage holin [Clostridium sp. YIM B02500]